MDIITLALSKKYVDKKVESQMTTITSAMVFDTYEELKKWIAVEENRAQLMVGANLYIRDLEVPDYWWDGEAIQQLETQKIDLSAYATTAEVQQMIEDAIGVALGGDY